MADTIKQMSGGPASRDQIAQAKGMLMLCLGISDDLAWQLMVRLSQTTNRKLRGVATVLGAHLLDGAALPEDLSSKLPCGLPTRQK
jgi:AmiR/NasT family two-component response regulator